MGWIILGIAGKFIAKLQLNRFRIRLSTSYFGIPESLLDAKILFHFFRESGFHPHPKEPPLFENGKHIQIDEHAEVKLINLRDKQ